MMMIMSMTMMMTGLNKAADGNKYVDPHDNASDEDDDNINDDDDDYDKDDDDDENQNNCNSDKYLQIFHGSRSR